MLCLPLLVIGQQVIVLGSLGSPPRPDSSYVEVLPDRYTFAAEAAVYGWGVVPAPCCVAQVSDKAAVGTLLIMDSGLLLLARPGATHRTFSVVNITGGGAAAAGFSAGSKVAISEAGVPEAVADSVGLRQLKCAPDLNTCAVGSTTRAAFGSVAAVVPVAGAHFVAAANGLFRCEAGSCAHLLGGDGGDETEAPITALAAEAAAAASGGSPGLPVMVAAGSADKVWLLSAGGAVVRWEWVTAISGPHLGSGGVLDGPVTALGFDPASGALLAGNDGEQSAAAPLCCRSRPSSLQTAPFIADNSVLQSRLSPCLLCCGMSTSVALNVHHAGNGNWGRISGDDGLPYANITAIATGGRDPVSGASQLWVGTAMGLVLKSADPAADPPFRYLFGPRYLPGKRVTAMGLLLAGAGVVAATEGGVSWLRQEPYTLARKAALMQAKLVRHDRHGPASRRRDCHSADTPSPSLLKKPTNGRGGCSRVTVSRTAYQA